MHLGILLTKHLDYSITAKVVAQNAGRALGLFIAKLENNGGLPYDVYTKLCICCVIQLLTHAAYVRGCISF